MYCVSICFFLRFRAPPRVNRTNTLFPSTTSLLSRLRSDDLATEAKGDGTPVTEADKDAEAYIRAELDAAHPDDAVLGEEEGDRAGTTGRRWIIDPIDRSEEHTSELQSLIRISYAVFCLK